MVEIRGCQTERFVITYVVGVVVDVRWKVLVEMDSDGGDSGCTWTLYNLTTCIRVVCSRMVVPKQLKITLS